MNHTLLERAKVFLQAHKNKSIWHRITTSLAAVVVFVTTYMLILPAITMERPTVCGLEEHTHTKACYASSLKRLLHEHDASCYEQTAASSVKGRWCVCTSTPMSAIRIPT